MTSDLKEKERTSGLGLNLTPSTINQRKEQLKRWEISETNRLHISFIIKFIFNQNKLAFNNCKASMRWGQANNFFLIGTYLLFIKIYNLLI